MLGLGRWVPTEVVLSPVSIDICPLVFLTGIFCLEEVFLTGLACWSAWWLQNGPGGPFHLSLQGYVLDLNLCG